MNNTIRLTKAFYEKSAISKAVEAYASIASIKIEETETSYICDVMSSKYDTQLVLNEFANYVLGIMNS